MSERDDLMVIHPDDVGATMSRDDFRIVFTYNGGLPGEIGRLNGTRVFVSPEAPRIGATEQGEADG